jgi:hypothetical protein
VGVGSTADYQRAPSMSNLGLLANAKIHRKKAKGQTCTGLLKLDAESAFSDC